MPATPFAELLRDARLLQGHTQTSLARLIGVSPGAISRWEAGDRRPTPEYLPLLAKHLRVPRRQLIDAFHRQLAA